MGATLSVVDQQCYNTNSGSIILNGYGGNGGYQYSVCH